MNRTSASRESRTANRLVHAGLALVAYVPVFRTHPGMLAADTKTYLYTNPGGLMRQAFYMWDGSVGNGTVTHQYIGYLFPMGPYYWLVSHLGIPMWVGQRFWLGSIFFAAGSGVVFFLRRLGVGSPGRPVAALAFMLSPYVLSYGARLSALLLPWAAIGWLVGLLVESLRRGGWRYPALFALVVAVTGTVNATSLIYAGVAPLAFIPYAIWVTRECSISQAVKTVLKIGLLSALVSLWWIVGLIIEFSYALNIVVYTESIVTVTLTSLSSEVMRGLGYWYFYGEDQIDNYIQAAPPYMTSVWLIAVGFVLPALQMTIGLLARWRYKAYCAALVLVGVVLAVGAYPYNNSTPFGAVLKAFQSTGIAGLALRSDNRAVPVAILGLAGLTGAGLSAMWYRWRTLTVIAGVFVAGGAVAGLPSFFSGNMIGHNLLFPQKLPSYYASEAKYLNSHDTSTRVLDEPGDDFAYYRWGTTIDPVEPALLTRPFVAREQVPYGSAASADLLNDFDETLAEETFNPLSLAPIARLMSAGDVVLRSDLAYERFNTPRPQQTWSLFNPAPPGLLPPIAFGTSRPSVSQRYPLLDESALALGPDAPQPPPLAVFPVTGTRPIVRTEPASTPILLDGDGMGMVTTASAGLLDHNPVVFYSPTFARDGTTEKNILDKSAQLVVTDSNYLAERKWGTMRENVGYIQQPGEPVLVTDPSAHTLPIFPGETDGDRTVAELSGVKHVVATSYGNPISYVPENKPYNAVDGNLNTVWTTGAFQNPVGQRLRIVLDHPITTNHFVLVQPLKGPRDRFITGVTITFGNGHGSRTSSIRETLGSPSRTAAGQTVTFTPRSFSMIEIRIDRINLLHEVYFAGVSGVGFAEIGIPGVTLHEVIRMPTDLLKLAGPHAIDHSLAILMSRRQAPPVPPRTDPELTMNREFTLPQTRSFSISGTARISALIPDNVIDQLLGRPGSDGSGIVATSSGRLPGDLNARASMALDGNPATAWMPGIGPQGGGWIQVALPASSSGDGGSGAGATQTGVGGSGPRVFDHLDLEVIADGRHSVPTAIRLTSASGSDNVALPRIPDSPRTDSTAAVPIDFPPLTGSWLRLTILKVRNVTNLDYYSGRPVIEPIGIAELGIPGVSEPPVPVAVPSVCRGNLLSIDGQPIFVEVNASSQAAASEVGTVPSLKGCGPDSAGITLAAGTHLVQTANGSAWQVGINIDTLNLASAPGGAAQPLTSSSQLPGPVPAPSPRLRVTSETPTSYKLEIERSGAPFWLVLGQSLNKGWSATVTRIGSHQQHISLGYPTLIDGMSNGWYVDPARLHFLPGNGAMTVSVTWTPQRYVLPALIISALAILACIALVIRPRSSPRNNLHQPPPPESEHASLLRHRLAIRAMVAAVATAAISGVFISPLLALPAALLVLLGVYLRPVRWLLGASGPALIAATAAYSAEEESRHGWRALFGWATHFQSANTLAWLSIAGLCAFVAVQLSLRPALHEPEQPRIGGEPPLYKPEVAPIAPKEC